MLKFDDLKAYFEQFLTNYGPYRNNKIYSIIIDNLLKYYINESYNIIPEDFKSAFENQKLPVSFYDNILLSVGFTQDLITKISYKDKEILLKTFTNFNIYKGTINQIQKVASDFEEDLNLYELLIDFREIAINFYYIRFFKNTNYILVENEYIYNSFKILDHIKLNGIDYLIKEKQQPNKLIVNKIISYDSLDEYIEIKNFNVKRWVFIPELVYSGDKVKNKVLKNFLDYESIYNKTPRYFLSKEYLEDLNKNDNLILPIKSNLVFLDYKKFRDINLLKYLFATIILKHYRKSRLILYFKDGKYSTSLEKIYKLWYYIIFKFYNKSIVNSGLPNPSLIFSIDSPYFKLEISDISDILKEYNLLETQYEVSLFYQKYFSTSFYPLNSFENEVPISQLELLMEKEIGLELITYINSRIDFAKGINSEFECSFILDEIYGSIFTWAFTNNISDISYLTDTLSYISTDIENSPTYNLILFLKPYHVDLIKESDDILEINNKFDLVNPYHKKSFIIDFYIGSLLNISHSLFKSELILKENNNLIILNSAREILIKKSSDFLQLLDSINQILIYEKEIVNFQNHNNLNFLKCLTYSFIIGISEINLNILSKNIDNIPVLNSHNQFVSLTKEIINNTNHAVSTDILTSIKDNLLIIIERSYLLIKKQLDSVSILHDHNLKDVLKILVINLLFIINHKYNTTVTVTDTDSSGKSVFDDFNIDLISALKRTEVSNSQSVNLDVKVIDVDSSAKVVFDDYNQIINSKILDIENIEDKKIIELLLTDVDSSGKSIFDDQSFNLYKNITVSKLISDNFLFSINEYSSMIATDNFFISLDP